MNVEKLEAISDAKSVGFTISEIGHLIETWYTSRYSKEEKIQLIESKLKTLFERIESLKNMKKLIGQFKTDVLNDLY